MPSAFPGMDPWLEAPYIWGDLHQRLATGMTVYLKGALPRPFYARMDARPQIGIVSDEGRISRHIGPDVAVARRSGRRAGMATAPSSLKVRAVSTSYEFSVPSESGKHVFVEIRDASRDHKLVTLIEIVSPSNKRKGKDRRSYLQKQREVLPSQANLVEIDLLRAGRRLYAFAEIEAMLASVTQRVDYLVLVSRGWKREPPLARFEAFPIALDETLPCISLPLAREIAEIPVDLQVIFDEAYDTGPYADGAVNYDKPPDPKLPKEYVRWAKTCLRKAGVL